MKFLDQARVYVRSGDGGAGCCRSAVSAASAASAARGTRARLWRAGHGDDLMARRFFRRRRGRWFFLLLERGDFADFLDDQLREAVARRCGGIVQIPQRGQVSSLNASAAGAILLYEVARQRGR